MEAQQIGDREDVAGSSIDVAHTDRSFHRERASAHLSNR
jgi:hypothetical protein